MNNNDTLDKLVKEQGELFEGKAVTDEKYKNEYINALDNAYNQNTFAYDDGGPLPGQPVKLNTGPVLDTENEKKLANQRLIAQAAQMKLKKEMEEFNKKPDAEKIRIYVVNEILKQQEAEYFKAHKFYMSGPIRKKTRKIIENNYRKGRYNITPQMKEDILYHLNLSSSQTDKNKSNPAKPAPANAQVRNLVSSI